MTKRESMVFYASWLDAVRALPKAMQGDVLLSMLEYGIEGKTVCKQGSVAMAMLAMVKPIIDANNQRYENGRKGGEFGVLGGRPKKTQENPTETPKKPQENPYNVNVNVNVNDNGDDESPTPAPAREETSEGVYVSTAALYDRMVLDTAWLGRVSKNTGTPIDQLGKELKEFCLVDQVYVKAEDGKQSVGQYLAAVSKAVGAEVKVTKFVRFETGEGLEKKNENFAEEVAKQMAH